MMKSVLVAVLLGLLLAGCASGPTDRESYLMSQYQVKGFVVKKKNPVVSAAFGLLPGGGSFYTGYPGFGILNLILWPVSILWDPVSGYNGAKMQNYKATYAGVKYQRQQAENGLKLELASGKLSKEDFLIKQNDLNEKYPQ
jgi:hypothetical protein